MVYGAISSGRTDGMNGGEKERDWRPPSREVPSKFSAVVARMAMQRVNKDGPGVYRSHPAVRSHASASLIFLSRAIN